MSERIVVVEDDRELRALLTEILEGAGYAVAAFGTAERALEHLRTEWTVDAVITDLILPGMRGQELLPEVRRVRPELNVVIITAFGSIESAIELVKAGAYDYLTKPFATDELLMVVDRALRDSRLQREIAQLRRIESIAIPGFVGASRAVQDLAGLVHKAAAASHPILISGESGTGKEVVARAIHRLSARAEMVALNCAALPEHLLESELFGHERGAFTGADRAKEGLFAAAHRGTLLLDEIAELPLALQPKLLRALESGEVRRVGSTDTQRVDVRIIAATNRDLEAMVNAGEFREDLYWRLNVLHLEIPPLRDRPVDIPLLAEHFLAQATRDKAAKRFSAAAMAVLTSYGWPGNARELRNAVERAVTLAEANEIDVADLPPRVREAGAHAQVLNDAADSALTLRELERNYIMRILQKTGGNKSRAAELLGLDRKTLYRKLEEFSRDPIV